MHLVDRVGKLEPFYFIMTRVDSVDDDQSHSMMLYKHHEYVLVVLHAYVSHFSINERVSRVQCELNSCLVSAKYTQQDRAEEERAEIATKFIGVSANVLEILRSE